MPEHDALRGGVPTGNILHWRQARDADVAARAATRAYRPQTPGQEAYWAAMQQRLLVACNGPGGAGKTLLACQMGAELFRAGKVRSLVFTRPLVTAGPGTGWLPGTATQKVAPFLFVLAGYLARMLPGQRLTVVTDPEAAADLSTPGVYFLPAEYARGVTLDDSFVFADECQNFPRGLLRLFTGRQGRGTRLVMSGHDQQCDLPGGPDGWLHWLGLLDSCADPDWAVVRLTHEDVLRSGVVAKTERLWDGEWGNHSRGASPPADEEPPPSYADVVHRGSSPRRTRKA